MTSRHLDTAVNPSIKPIGWMLLLWGALLAMPATGWATFPNADELLMALRDYVAFEEDDPQRQLYFQQGDDRHRIEQLRVQFDGGEVRRVTLTTRQGEELARGGLMPLGAIPDGARRGLLQASGRRAGSSPSEAAEVWRLDLSGHALAAGKPVLVELQRNPWTLIGRRLALGSGPGSRVLQARSADFLVQTGSALPAALMLLRQQKKTPLNALEGTLLEAAIQTLRGSAIPRAATTSGEEALAAFNQATATATPAHRAILEQIGTSEMNDTLGWSVRDRANLVLGYEALRQRRPEDAEMALARVRTVGPYTNAARLGLGWAQISAAGLASGAGLRPRGEDATAEMRRSTPFRTAFGVAHGALAESLKRALQPWTDMIGADPLDPAVQESMLAIPYALGHLGAHEDALDRTEQALSTLHKLDSRLRSASERVAAGEFVAAMLATSDGKDGENADLLRHQYEVPDALVAQSGSRWWRKDVWPAYFYAERLFERGDIQQLWRHCAELQQGLQLLARGGSGDPSRFEGHRTQLRLAESQCREQLAEQTAGVLRIWLRSVEAYLNEGRLAIARMHDSHALAVGQVAGGF